MSKKPFPIVTVTLGDIVGGGQTIATIADPDHPSEQGRKVFVWGGLPHETVMVQLTKKKARMAEGYVVNVITPSPDRIEPVDPDSYLSTSPWQIMTFAAELAQKARLIDDAFTLHNVTLPATSLMYTDHVQYGYRNKMEFSWYWDKQTDMLDLAFFRRGSHGKIQVDGSSLAMPAITDAATALREVLRANHTSAADLKTLLLRSTQQGRVVMQLYVKNDAFEPFDQTTLQQLGVTGFELLFSNPKSPASVITKRLQAWGDLALTDTIDDVPFRYAAESFFQVNLPVYQKAIADMKKYVLPEHKKIDLYSGVGTIGLTIGGTDVTLVEINPSAVAEMQQNIASLQLSSAQAILAPTEQALDYLTDDATVIVDPPRAGLHQLVVERLLDVLPPRIIYLSCNPVTQARDVSLLLPHYAITAQQGYNFFPRTPHIEHLIILDRVTVA